MSSEKPESLSLQPHALTPDRWPDAKNRGEGNRKYLKRIVDSGIVPGVIAYHNNQPVGWCSLVPRETYPALEHSRILKGVDDKEVWSVVCFFTAKQFRHKDVTTGLLKAAVDFTATRRQNHRGMSHRTEKGKAA